MITKIKLFENIEKQPQIESVKYKDINEIIRLMDIIFPDSIGFNDEYCREVVDWSMSIKLTYQNKIIGFYLFNEYQFPELEGEGVQGVAIGIDPNYRNRGWGKMLIEYPYKKFRGKYDYIWLQHFKHLKNIHHWEKRHKVIDINSNLYITYTYL